MLGNDSILPFHSGNRFYISKPGVYNFISTIGFGSHNEFRSIDEIWQKLADDGEIRDSHIVAKSGKIKSISFSVFLDRSKISDFTPPVATLYGISDGSTIEVVAKDVVTLSFLEGSIDLNIPKFVAVGTRLILVVRFHCTIINIETSPESPIKFQANVIME